MPKPSSCQNCSLESHGYDFSQPEGLGRLGVCVVAEASGEAEARDQLPLRPYAPSGGIYERTLRRLGLDRDLMVTTNCIRCRPRENLLEGMYYEQDAIKHCEPNLLAVLAKYKPKVLVALGNVPLRTLTGWSGEKKTVSHLRGFVLRALPQFCAAAGNPNLCVIPTYHPAFLRRGAIHLSGVLARDIMLAVRVSQSKYTSFILDAPEIENSGDTYLIHGKDPWDEGYEEAERQAQEAIRNHVECWMQRHSMKYVLHPSLANLDAFCREIKAISEGWQALTPDAKLRDLTALSYDLETVESKDLDEDASDGYTDTVIRLIQFSAAPGTAIAMPWTGDYIKAARWLLKLPLPKIGHNETTFDWKVLRAVGERDYGSREYLLPAGPRHDTLTMFHRWQPDLPANLQFAASFASFPLPWKHMAGTNLELYGCFDVDATLRLYHTMRHTMDDRKMWFDEVPGREAAGYVAQCEQVRPVLTAMEDRGLPIDDERRLALDVEFAATAAEVFSDLDAKFPDEARKIEPKEGYATVPPEVRKLLGIRPKTKRKKDAPPEEPWPKPIAVEEVSKLVFEKPGSKLEDGTREEGEFFHYAQRTFTPDVADLVRWCRVYEFSPNSPHQLKRYMTVKKHKIPSMKDGKETTAKKELERLSIKHGDPFYMRVIEYRELTKMRGTYIDGFKPHADGRVHPTIKFSTATDQLAASNPNCMNFPKHARLAKAIRAMVRHPTKLVVEWDFKSYHALTLGFLANSPNYMRLSRIDIHSFVAWHFMKLPGADKLWALSDAELLAQLKWFKSDPERKKVRDKPAKQSILAIGFGAGPEKIYSMYREYFNSLAEVKTLRKMIEGLFPEIFRWQNYIRDVAHKQTYLRNRFGAMRWFYEVYVPDGRGGMRPGEQSEQALAFLPASEAFGNMREAMKELDRRGLCEKWELVNTVHDSLVFLVAPEKIDEHLAEVYPVLHAPSKVLVDPVLAPGGLVIDVEVGAGESWADLQDLKLPTEKILHIA